MRRQLRWLLLALPGFVGFACGEDAVEPGPRDTGGSSGDNGAGESHGEGGAAGTTESPPAAGTPSTGGGTASTAGVGPEGGAGGASGAEPRDDGGAGAGGQDAGSGPVCHDGSRGEGATCESYCAAWFPLCKELLSTASVYEDAADCSRRCQTFTAEQICCRGYHVTNAPKNAATHCRHAAGLSICP